MVDGSLCVINRDFRFGSEEEAGILRLIGFSGNIHVTINGLKNMQHIGHQVPRHRISMCTAPVVIEIGPDEAACDMPRRREQHRKR